MAMENSKKEKPEKLDQAKGDAILRRLLKMPPKPHVRPKKKGDDQGRRLPVSDQDRKNRRNPEQG